VTLVVAANVVLTAAATFGAYRAAVSLGMEASFATWATALAVVLPFSAWSAHAVVRRIVRRVSALTDVVSGLHEADFSLRVASGTRDEISDLVSLYNREAEVMRLERSEVHQRELLLDSILQRSPMAVLMVNAGDRIVYSNSAAREMFGGGARLDGSHFAGVEQGLLPELRDALRAGGDAIFSAPAGDQEETFRVSQRVVHLNTQRHRLILLERLTPELRRQEVNIWKKAIRVINHELNNSLAPVSSLFHSARLVRSRPDQEHRLDEIYEAIQDRLEYLRRFLEGYAQFARLPQPRKETVLWLPFLDEVRRLYPFDVEGDPPRDGTFDRGQIQQVLINLLKNAHESGSKEVTVSVDAVAGGARLRVMDRGPGMTEETMRQAILPFYSTKEGGTGLGLALCSEILEAHGGRLRLQAREGGGTVVTCWIPDQDSSPA
jgi:nitrogen fixation/metabolism regulation signal transduction histidine kinase